MSFSDTPTAVALELSRDLQSYPTVRSVSVLPSDESASGQPELELVCSATKRGTVPNTITHCVTRSSLGIVRASDNGDEHKTVLIR